MPRLSAATLQQLSFQVRQSSPNGESALSNRNRIAHIGLGQFAKAHLAFYTQALARQQGRKDWLITGISLHSDRSVRQLVPQDCLYSISAKSSKGEEISLVDVLEEVLFVGDEPSQAFNVLLDAATKIVSLTITEKGYHQAPEGGLHLEDEDIQHDLANWQKPRTAIGWLVQAISHRRQLGRAPFTVMSLDNLNQNGRVLSRVITEFAELIDPSLAEYIKANIKFPCSMVDRIVPGMNAQTLDEVEHELGIRDEACVVTEAFSQWVLEDQFSAGRPDWQQVGVQLCENVEPYEAMKLSLLNGAHSAIAYLGCLSELSTVADCMSDTQVRAFVERLMKQEILPEVVAPDDTNLNAYIDSLLERFSNEHLHHQCAQIAMDGSQKIPQRWLPILLKKLGRESMSDQARSAGVPSAAPSFQLLSFALAAWIGFVRVSPALKDPLAAQLKQWTSGSVEDAVKNLFAESGLFETVLRDGVLPQAVMQHLTDIETNGVHDAIAHIVLQQDNSQ